MIGTGHPLHYTFKLYFGVQRIDYYDTDSKSIRKLYAIAITLSAIRKPKSFSKK